MLFKHMLKNITCPMKRKDEDMYEKAWDEEAGAMRFEDTDMDTGQSTAGNWILTGWWFGCHFLFSHILGV